MLRILIMGQKVHGFPQICDDCRYFTLLIFMMLYYNYKLQSKNVQSQSKDSDYCLTRYGSYNEEGYTWLNQGHIACV